jgi:hypothetical protein
MNAPNARLVTRFLGICFAAIVLPVAAQAQGSALINLQPNPEQYAAAMAAQSAQLSNQPDRWGEAASILRYAGQVPGSDRGMSFTRLLGAAAIYANAGKLAEARGTALEAATQAISYGEVEEAAIAFHRAAVIGRLQHDLEFAKCALSMVELLAGAPNLSPEQGVRIRGLFSHTSSSVEALNN